MRALPSTLPFPSRPPRHITPQCSLQRYQPRPPSSFPCVRVYWKHGQGLAARLAFLRPSEHTGQGGGSESDTNSLPELGALVPPLCADHVNRSSSRLREQRTTRWPMPLSTIFRTRTPRRRYMRSSLIGRKSGMRSLRPVHPCYPPQHSRPRSAPAPSLLPS